jgi:hypothetical protein
MNYNTDACGGIVLSSRDCNNTLHTLSGDDVRGVGAAPVSGTLTFAFCLPCVLLRASTFRGGCEECASRLICLQALYYSTGSVEW